MQRLKGKTSFITAAAQGIGKEIARRFSQEGSHVFACDLNPNTLEHLKQEIPTLEIFQLDATNPQAIQSLRKKLPKIDILVNAVGFVHHGTILDCSLEDWEKSFKINVTSMFHMIQAFLPKMLEQQSGNIVNIASVASSIKGVPMRSAYSTTKAAIIGLSKSLAADYVSQGIRCNVICPGTVATPSLEERITALGGDREETKKNFCNRQPLGRLGKAEEIAALAAYLAADESAFTTGAVHIIDGGWTN